MGFIVYRTLRNMERLRKVNAEKERIDGELHVAGQIQQSMLPSVNMSHEGMEVFGSLVPAREVGGDLYDYFVRDEKLFFCIGDVSGKGTPSAMLMVSAHSLFRAFSVHESNPARIMQAINEAACQGNDTNMFVTLFIGVLDLPTGRLRYCDAGHDAPFVINSKLVALPVDPHLPIGVFDDFQYGVQEMQLTPGSTVFLYTDGLTEAKNAERKQFGLQRTEEVLGGFTGRDSGPQEVISAVREAVHLFVNGAEQSDDLTLLAIRYVPSSFASVVDESITLRNDVREVSSLNGFQKTVYDKIGLDRTLAGQLKLAVEEAVVNSIEYAYPPGVEGDVEVRIMWDGNRLKVIITDAGSPFDPTSMEKADTSLSAEDRRIGGLGILLVRELMDAVNYERIEGRNVLTLIKNSNNKQS
jgi:sigma-B regulation protein RsbU (phosphoserine phosphatase)